MEARGSLLKRKKAQVFGEPPVDGPLLPLEVLDVPGRNKGDDLPRGIHPGVGPPGALDEDLRPEVVAENLLERPLDRPPFFLAFEAEEISPEISDARLDHHVAMPPQARKGSKPEIEMYMTRAAKAATATAEKRSPR